jgi:putative flippase GtrA
VSSIRRLYARFRQLIHEGFKFLVIGAVGFIVTFGVANALHPIGPYKAITIATIMATVITYLGNRYWTFRHREGKGTTRDSVMFFVFNGVGLLIYWGCIGVIDLAGLRKDLVWYNIALVVGTGLGTLFRFWSYRKWIWREKPAVAHGEPPEEEAHDLAAVVGAVPATEHPAAGWDAFARPSANGASANGAAGNHAGTNDAGSAPRSHARPGRPSVRPAPDGQREPGSHAPASHRRTS